MAVFWAETDRFFMRNRVLWEVESDEPLSYNIMSMESSEKKYDNKYLLERQLEMIKTFYERKLLSKEQYEFEVQTLTTRIKTDEEKES